MFKMNDSLIKCPNCDSVLEKDNSFNLYKCINNHSFDIAKQGYINLLMSNQKKSMTHGDSKEMLEARKQILFGGHYKCISDLLNNVVKDNTTNKFTSILDLGSGIGYYLKELKDSITNEEINYYGIDIAKPGIIEACKLDKDINWIVGSSNKLPYLNNSMDILISIFSPFTISECERVLKKDGLFIIISPNQNHLIELKEEIYPNIIPKREDRNELSSNIFKKVDSYILKEKVLIKKNNLKNLLLMTPHYWKSGIDAKEKLYLLEHLYVSLDVELNIYKLN